MLISMAGVAEMDKKTSALFYLMKYGYVETRTNSSALLTQDGLDKYLKQSIMDFQAFAGLNQTGELDSTTAELMEAPRCGVKDIIGHGATARRRKRYVLQGSKWRVRELSYKVSQYPSSTRLSKAEIDGQMKKAFQMWESATNLKFTEKRTGSVHIDIRFEKFEHGDGDAFDGAGGTLAHAYFPQYGGDVHVDDSEYWTIESFKGTNLLQTMVHELGHSLGLSHSDVRDSIMAPFYRGWEPNLRLSKDDEQAIQAIYGESKAKPTPKPTPSPPTSPRPEPINPGGSGGSGGGQGSGGSAGSLCGDGKIDAIFSTKDGTSYVFQGSNYWRLTDDSVAEGYPRKIQDDWSGLPADIDAAFTWKNFGATYFFKGSQYWKFENMEAQPDYPRALSKGFPSIPGDIDAAFVWGGNGKIYFFKGTDYWKFDPEKTPHVQSGKYPRDISQWGLPSNLDGALQWDNGKTYFFKGGEYWRFNDRKFNVDRANPAFPRNTGEWWFGCPKVRPLVSGGNNVALLPGSEGVAQTVDYPIYIQIIDEDEDYYTITGGNEDLDAGFDSNEYFDS